MTHAGIVHPTVLALCYLLPQVRQPNVGPVLLNQFLLSIVAPASAFPARQTHYAGRIVAKPERTAVHWNILFRPPNIWVVVGVRDDCELMAGFLALRHLRNELHLTKGRAATNGYMDRGGVVSCAEVRKVAE